MEKKNRYNPPPEVVAAMHGLFMCLACARERVTAQDDPDGTLRAWLRWVAFTPHSTSLATLCKSIPRSVRETIRTNTWEENHRLFAAAVPTGIGAAELLRDVGPQDHGSM